MLHIASGEQLPRFTGASVFTAWQPLQLITIGLIVVAAAYLYGVRRLTARGDAWPVHRTVLFLAGGLVPMAFVTIGGIGTYDDQLLSVHMVQHMVLGMIAPIFLALGAPVTLALRTLPARPRRWLVATMHSKVVKVLSFPLVSYGLYVTTPFALYFSGLYQLTLRHEWLHELVHLHFVVIGCLFFWPLIGIDPLPGRWPYPARALLMLISTPFHAVLGLTIMQSKTLLGGGYYPSLHLAWANAYTDQKVAGGILWAGGEVVSVTMLAVLVTQWMKASEKESRRIDRQLDREEAAAREEAIAQDGEVAQDGLARDEAADAAAGADVPLRSASGTSTTVEGI